jgi:hypothetical protein
MQSGRPLKSDPWHRATDFECFAAIEGLRIHTNLNSPSPHLGHPLACEVVPMGYSILTLSMEILNGR